MECLQNILGVEEIEDYVIAEELHQNGNPHLHCYLKLKHAVDTRDPRHFDINTVVGEDDEE